MCVEERNTTPVSVCCRESSVCVASVLCACCGALTRFAFFPQLEMLVGTLEDSFSSSEQMLSNSPATASPHALATLKAEKRRRQTLLKKLTQVVKSALPIPPRFTTFLDLHSCVGGPLMCPLWCAVQLVAASANNSVMSDDAQNTTGSFAIGASMDMGPSAKQGVDVNALQDDETGSTEWKHTTLVRLRKFLRRQYRARKNKVVDSVSYASEDMGEERAQLQQLAADIKSIEFEIRLLSTNASFVQHGKQGHTGSAESKDGAQGDSARSQKDTVKRLLGSSASSFAGGSGSRMSGVSTGERLAGLHEGDEDTAGEDDPAEELRGVRRNLLDLYNEPPPNIAVAASMPSMQVDAGVKSNISTRLLAQEGPARATTIAEEDNLPDVDACIEAIKALGAKVRLAEAATGVQQADNDAGVAVEEEENSTSPCKIARHARQEEHNTSPCKIARLARQLEREALEERENNSSPSKIDRIRRRMAAVRAYLRIKGVRLRSAAAVCHLCVIEKRIFHQLVSYGYRL